MIKETFDISERVKPRSRYEILASLMEEVGELSTEVAVIEGYSIKQPGEGTIGEGVDVIINVLDLIWLDHPGMTHEELKEAVMSILKVKLTKWLKKKS